MVLGWAFSKYLKCAVISVSIVAGGWKSLVC